jgi:serine/threonine protein phosphatase PrpC
MLSVACRTASSRARSDDRVAVHRIDDGIVIVVADGSGGMAGAGRAAELVLSSVDAALRASPSTDWPRVLSLADDVIHRDRDAGETTAVVVSVSAAGASRGASAGDSRDHPRPGAGLTTRWN